MWPAIIAAATAPLWVPPMYKGLKGGIDELFGTDLSNTRAKELGLARYREGLAVEPFLDDEAELMAQESFSNMASILEDDYDPLSEVTGMSRQMNLSAMLEANKQALDAISIKDDGRPSFEEVALRMGLV